LLIDVLLPLVRDSNGTVNVEWHHFPLHNPDPTLHVVGLADRSKFWKFLYTVMLAARQDPQMQLNVSMDRIVQLAGAAEISETQVRRAYDDESNWAAIQDDELAGKLLGMRGTPGLFYSGYFLTSEGVPKDIAAFDASLRQMLNIPLRQ
jgi:protein-disulfide isomerase